MKSPLSLPCPHCQAPAGVKCRNWKDQYCAPHAARQRAFAQLGRWPGERKTLRQQDLFADAESADE